MTLRAIALPAAGLVTLAVVALATGSPARSASASAASPFTASQAGAGAKAYAQNCARCHGASLEGVSAPALHGNGSGLEGDSIGDAYTFISTQMPAGNPGSLSAKDYVNIVAFILTKNGHKPGTATLTPAVAKSDKAKV